MEKSIEINKKNSEIEEKDKKDKKLEEYKKKAFETMENYSIFGQPQQTSLETEKENLISLYGRVKEDEKNKFEGRGDYRKPKLSKTGKNDFILYKSKQEEKLYTIFYPRVLFNVLNSSLVMIDWSIYKAINNLSYNPDKNQKIIYNHPFLEMKEKIFLLNGGHNNVNRLLLEKTAIKDARIFCVKLSNKAEVQNAIESWGTLKTNDDESQITEAIPIIQQKPVKDPARETTTMNQVETHDNFKGGGTNIKLYKITDSFLAMMQNHPDYANTILSKDKMNEELALLKSKNLDLPLKEDDYKSYEGKYFDKVTFPNNGFLKKVNRRHKRLSNKAQKVEKRGKLNVNTEKSVSNPNMNFQKFKYKGKRKLELPDGYDGSILESGSERDVLSEETHKPYYTVDEIDKVVDIGSLKISNDK
tara:strand:+ start:14600 stop:15847 length:1248 start_codon:yes stop_codon:yes gene_type:complete